MKTWIHTRSFRSGLVSTILILWTALVLPFDIWGAQNHWESLHLYLAAHLAVFIASAIVLTLSISRSFCLKNTANTQSLQRHEVWLQPLSMLLLLAGSVLQIAGSMVYSDQYCSFVARNDSALWSGCIVDSYGIYLVLDSGLSSYLAIVIFAERFQGVIPLIAISFGKTFRVLFVSMVSATGMIMVAVYGFMVYDGLNDDEQAIYIGFAIVGVASICVIVDQFLLHCPCTPWLCTDRAQIHREPLQLPLDDDDELQHPLQPKRESIERAECLRTIERALCMVCHFLIYSGIAVILMYSLFSKIPNAVLIEDVLRMIGQNLLIAGSGLLVSYELAAKNDDYSETVDRDHYSYRVIPDGAL